MVDGTATLAAWRCRGGGLGTGIHAHALTRGELSVVLRSRTRDDDAVWPCNWCFAWGS